MSRYDSYLKTNLSRYTYADKARKDLNDALLHYKDLRPSVQQFIFNDGTARQLMSLDGTLPVSYQGNTYNIPICVFFIETHPYNPPMVFVRPTSTMQIKPGRYVDANGKVYLPYITDWTHPRSNLPSLLGILQTVFGESPPVFAKSAAAAAAATPPRPNYPPYSGPGYQPMPQPGVAANGSYPGSGWGSSGYMPQTTQATPYPVSQGYQSSGGPYGYGTILPEDTVLMSLRSAVEDKMRRVLQDVHSQHAAELEVLKRTQEDLQKGSRSLQEMLDKMERETSELERGLHTIEDKNREMDEALSKMTRQESLNVDEAVDTTAPLYRQLLSAFAEEQAIEDAIYYLGEALGKNVIDVEYFLKKVRELSRRQFMLRATVQKCREKAGLPNL